MSDLDIVVKLDPGQPVAGAQAVTAELAKTETQAKKTEDAAKGIAKLNFKQAAAGANQAFSLLNQKLGIADTEFGKVVGSATQFGALGAQMAGPWGAAAGAIVGALVEMDGAFVEFIETAERMEAALQTTDQRIAVLVKGSSSLGVQFDALTKGARSMSDAIVLVAAHLQSLHNAQATFVSLGPVLAKVNEQLEAQKRILGDLNDPRANFVRDMTALNLLFKNGAISAVDYVKRQSEMATSFATHEGVVTKTVAAYKELEDTQRRVFGGMAILTESSERNILTPGFTPTAVPWAVPEQPKIDDGDMGRQRDMMNARAGQAQAQAEWLKKSAEEAQKLEQSIGSVGSVLKDSLVPAAQSFASTLVDAANGADVSWSGTFKRLALGLQQAITQAIVLKALTGSYSGAAGANGKAIGGLFGLMGFASGGTIYPSGPGSTDSMAVSFRKRPDETVHINTPSQERAYQQGGAGGSTTVQVVYSGDPRALMQGGADVQRIVLDTMRANPGPFRALLGR